MQNSPKKFEKYISKFAKMCTKWRVEEFYLLKTFKTTPITIFEYPKITSNPLPACQGKDHQIEHL
jgi:hypothetical protein